MTFEAKHHPTLYGLIEMRAVFETLPFSIHDADFASYATPATECDLRARDAFRVGDDTTGLLNEVRN